MLNFINPRVAVVLTVGVAAMAAAPLHAANIVWNGNIDNDYGKAANWQGGVLPANNDFADYAIFGSGTPATPGTLTMTTSIPTSGGQRQHQGLKFTNAGWTIDVPFTQIGPISSLGAGTNTLNSTANTVPQIHEATAWTVGVGNTLFLADGLYQKNFGINLGGGGTLRVASAIGGFGTTGGFKIQADTTLQVDAATPYSSAAAGTAYISNATARLLLKTQNTTAVTAMFGTRIVDQVGNGLTASIYDSQYVLVTSTAIAVPEPATAGVVALGLGAVALRRRRQV